MKDLLTFVGEFYVFVINAPWLLVAPFVIAIGALMIYPFTGKDGQARLMAFMWMAIVPVFLYMMIVGDLIEQYEKLSFPPLVWLALMWLMALSFKHNLFGMEN